VERSLAGQGGGAMPDIGPPALQSDPVPPPLVHPVLSRVTPGEAPATKPAPAEKPVELTNPPAQPEAARNDPSAASVLDKLYRYTLNPDHSKGKDKAEWFRRAPGFTRSNIDALAKQIVFDAANAVQTSVTEYGTKFNQTIEVLGANGKTLPILTAWIKGNDGIPRLVTALPGK
jgi:hypothetical protein